MPPSNLPNQIDEIIAALDRGERFDDVRPQYVEAVRMRWRQWPAAGLVGLAIGLVVGMGTSWAQNDFSTAALCAISLFAVLAFGSRRIERFVRLDLAVSRWKHVADARAAAGRR